MKLALEEQETIIRWDRKDSDTIVYTFEPSLKKKLKELEHQFPDLVRFKSENNGSVEYIVPKALISIRKPRKVSDQAKERMKERGRALKKGPDDSKDPFHHQAMR